MKRFKLCIMCLCIGIFTVLIMGCQKKAKLSDENVIQYLETEPPIQTDASTQNPTIVPIKEPSEVSDKEGQLKSKLTGLWVEEEIAKQRPYAIMFNNIKTANPQSGIGQATILYEALVEGGITRCMGLFEEFDAKKIGSVRSARHYFVSFADEYDAIFVHFGQSTYGKKKIAELKIDTLNGLDSIGSTVFYRDNSIKAPHNAFASYESIIKGTKKKQYRTQYKEAFEGHFQFYDEDVSLKSEKSVRKITLPFSGYTSPYFVYDEKKKQYARFQFKEAHIDKSTNQQLQYKNIIVQFVKQWTLDKKGYQSMDIENSSGTGYYITNGELVEVTWKKIESKKEMHYYNLDGTELMINPGKTYIAVFPNNQKKEIKIES